MSGGDADWMRAALALAARGLGQTGENPSVGCVLVRDGRVMGRGRTAPGGRPHAEVVALADAAARNGQRAAQGATAYVTLEPCAHHGKTPPCTDALIAAGVVRVVAPISDPDSRVSGRGFAALEAAGIAVTAGVERDAAEAVLRGYLCCRRKGRPSVTLKLAASLDGRIATATGQSRWITGPAARRRVHLMRARHDCVLVGSGTVEADDPALDIRIAGLEQRRPIRAVADRRLRTPSSARMLSDGGSDVLILGDADAFPDRATALHDQGARVEQIAADAPITEMLHALAARGISSVFCEGGGGIARALMRAGCVDRLVWFSAGTALGAEGHAAIAPLGLDRLADAPRFALQRVERVGDDTMSEWLCRDDTSERDG